LFCLRSLWFTCALPRCPLLTCPGWIWLVVDLPLLKNLPNHQCPCLYVILPSWQAFQEPQNSRFRMAH
jgi:hypothetical protein